MCFCSRSPRTTWTPHLPVNSRTKVRRLGQGTEAPQTFPTYLPGMEKRRRHPERLTEVLVHVYLDHLARTTLSFLSLVGFFKITIFVGNSNSLLEFKLTKILHLKGLKPNALVAFPMVAPLCLPPSQPSSKAPSLKYTLWITG